MGSIVGVKYNVYYWVRMVLALIRGQKIIDKISLGEYWARKVNYSALWAGRKSQMGFVKEDLQVSHGFRRLIWAFLSLKEILKARNPLFHSKDFISFILHQLASQSWVVLCYFQYKVSIIFQVAQARLKFAISLPLLPMMLELQACTLGPSITEILVQFPSPFLLILLSLHRWVE